MAFKKLKYWFDVDLAQRLGDMIFEIDTSFDKRKFVQSIGSQVDTLELKARVEVFADELDKYLLKDYPEQLAVLLQVLGPENKDEIGMFRKYYWIMPIAKFVEKYGLQSYNLSINAIAEITKRNTGEYAIRPYLEQETKKTLAVMKRWSKDKNMHIRRLASEGVRPRLPWAKKLDVFIQEPELILGILNNLKDDSSKFVQKSVANCINDIIKDNEVVAKDLLISWKSGATKERKWIINHALRNLLKKDIPWAIQLHHEIFPR